MRALTDVLLCTEMEESKAMTCPSFQLLPVTRRLALPQPWTVTRYENSISSSALFNQAVACLLSLLPLSPACLLLCVRAIMWQHHYGKLTCPIPNPLADPNPQCSYTIAKTHEELQSGVNPFGSSQFDPTDCVKLHPKCSYIVEGKDWPSENTSVTELSDWKTSQHWPGQQNFPFLQHMNNFSPPSVGV